MTLGACICFTTQTYTRGRCDTCGGADPAGRWAELTADNFVALLASARVRVDPDYDIDGPLNWWDLELAAERRHLGDVRAMRQTDAARAAVNAEKRRLRGTAVVDPCAILDEPGDAA